MQGNNQQYGVDAYLSAVNLLFHSENKDLKVKANKFLVDFETKFESWDVAFQVLIKDNLSEEAYYNALNILKRKIKYDFGNFSENPEYIEKLLSFLETNIDKFKKLKHYILINYCDCVGKAFLFTGDKFKSMLQKFTIKLYNQKDDINNLISLLLIFNFICETCYDKSIVIDDKSRKKIRDNLKDISDDVFQFIIFLINKVNTYQDKQLQYFIINQILDTLINYLDIDLDEDIYIKFNKEYLPIINFIFTINEENLEKYSDCICNLLNFPLNEGKMRPLAQIIFSKILQFKDIFYKTFESLDEEQVSFYIDVFTSMVENNFDEILNEKRYDLFQIIVDLTKKSPAKKIDIIGDFFKDLNEYLYSQNYSIEETMNIFKNIFIQLILNLINLTKFEVDIFSKLNITKTKFLSSNDEYNNTLDFRISAKDIIEDFINNYGFNFIFNEILFPEFNKIILKIKENQKNINNWCEMENLIYIFSCMIQFLNMEEESNENIIIFLYTIFDIPKEFIQITRVISEIVDNCPKLILISNKELLFKCLKYLVNGLDNELILKYCSVSAKELLTKTKEIMSEFRLDLLSLYETKLKNKILDNSKYLYIVEGIITVVTYSDKNKNNYDIIKNTIVSIMQLWVISLQEAKTLLEKNNQLSPEDDKKLNELLIILKNISRAAFEGLFEDNKIIMYEILVEIWPSIIFILNKMSTNINIVENIIQFLKIYMRELKDNFIQFIPEYVKCIINGYKLSPISSYLYAFEILVTVFPMPKTKEIKIILNNTFNEFCKITLNGYIKKEFDLNIFVNIGEDFFGMLYRIINISPLLLLENEECDNIIQTSLNYINTPQIQISKNIMTFFSYIISFKESKSFQKIKEIDNITSEKCQKIIQNRINNFSSILCKKILDIFIEATVEQIRENVTELFLDFIKYQKSLVINGMQMHLKDVPNDILTNKEKIDFINLINKYSKENKNELLNFIDNFVNRCIGKQLRSRGEN